MGIVIDISSKRPSAIEADHEAPADGATPIVPDSASVVVEQEGFQACRHRHMSIDKKQRTVKCADCGIWLDPVWCLTELFYYYETRVDQRVGFIEEWEAKQAAAEKRKRERKERPRHALLERRDEELDRAIYNEYQAKKLALRAARQRERAAKLDTELGTDVTTETA